MSKLVEELKKEHAIITNTLNKVKTLGLTSKEGQNTLLAARDGLLAHIKKEDEYMYPILRNAAENDTSLKQTLDMFAKDMDKISKTALEFFKKYSTGGSGIEYAKDFGAFFAKLSQRIRNEENILFQKYDELKR